MGRGQPGEHSHDHDVAIDAANDDDAKAMADAKQQLADALALAAKDRAYAVADAETGLATAREDAAKTATAAWAATEGTPSAQYLSALENDEDQYIHDSMGARDTLLHDEADADYAKAQTLDAATDSEQKGLADLATQNDALSQNSSDLATKLAQADEDRLLNTDIPAAKDEADKSVKYAGDYLLKADQAVSDQAYAYAKAYRIFDTKHAAIGEADMAASWYFAFGGWPFQILYVDLPSYVAQDAAIATELKQSFAQADNALTHAETSAEETLESKQLPNKVQYDSTIRDAMAAEIESLATDRQADQSSANQAQHDFSVPAASAQADLAKAQAAASEQHVIDLAVADQGYSDSIAVYQQNQSVSDAEANQTFEDTLANNYSSQVQAWAQSVNTPWANYQAELATASANATAAETAANVAQAQAMEQPNVTAAQAINAATEEQAQSDAAAALLALNTITDDEESQAQPLADSQLQAANQITTATAAAQTADAGAWASAGDSAEQQFATYEDTTLHDGWTETLAVADASLNLALGTESGSQYNSDVATAQATQKSNDAAALRAIDERPCGRQRCLADLGHQPGHDLGTTSQLRQSGIGDDDQRDPVDPELRRACRRRAVGRDRSRRSGRRGPRRRPGRLRAGRGFEHRRCRALARNGRCPGRSRRGHRAGRRRLQRQPCQPTCRRAFRRGVGLRPARGRLSVANRRSLGKPGRRQPHGAGQLSDAASARGDPACRRPAAGGGRRSACRPPGRARRRKCDCQRRGCRHHRHRPGRRARPGRRRRRRELVGHRAGRCRQQPGHGSATGRRRHEPA